MQWDSFMDNLTGGKVIPIIGNDLSLIKDKNQEPVFLYDYIAEELTKRLGIPYTGQTINELTITYPNANVMLTTHSIYNKLEEDRFFLEPLEKLTEITDFNFYITTVLDDLLIKTLYKLRGLKKNQLRVINYSLQQIYDSFIFEDEETPPPVTVFNLLGSLGNVAESASTEEEILEHFYSLTSKYNRNPVADYFMEQLKNKILLFIGCDFPDWFMRFIIRILTNQRYKFRIFSDYIVFNNIGKCPDLKNFLEQFNKNIVIIDNNGTGNTRAFIDELYDKWSKFLVHRPLQYRDPVFLSYVHADQEKVKILKNFLKAKGIRNAWLDIEDLDAGEHQLLIKEEIKKCKVFIPVISKNSLKNRSSYTWKVEWAGIKSRFKADKFYERMTFHIIPVILDDTQIDDRRIPKFMRDFSIWNLDKNKDRIIEEITKVLTPL